MENVEKHRCFGGEQFRFKHQSASLKCEMHFSVYMPPAANNAPVPLIYWLSGLTCNDQNFVAKAGAQQFAAQHGIAIIAPDTSPRGEAVPDDSEGAFDFGLGAGFYLNATQAPWSEHYNMYDYIVSELPQVLRQLDLPLQLDCAAISGHSMGGHGALSIGLKNPDKFRSISAFAPIVAPSQCPWGEKAFSAYLGKDRETWSQYDSCLLLEKARHLPTLVDQGTDDDFLDVQLRTPLLRDAAEQFSYPMSIRMQPGYDHSYFFVASFIAEHIQFHAKHLF
nr:S-formylglutathione hydrolase [Cellvibrionaceae bacterium]